MWQVQDHADLMENRRYEAVERLVMANGGFMKLTRPVHVARAPGRLDVMGGIADYSGSLVLEMPLAAATLVAVQIADDQQIVVRSPSAAEFDADTEVTVSTDEIAPFGSPLTYEQARTLLTSVPERRWAAYVIGTLVALAREKGMAMGRGVRVLVDSTVPTGKGVSSSAALEVATMRAVCAAFGVALTGRELALLCQQVENLVVGAPCGVMDQMTSACGEKDRLLALLCQPAELDGHVGLSPEVELWGIDSGVRHEIGRSDYSAVRVGAFMGYRILADIARLPVRPSGDGRVVIEDSRWRGYLANVTPSEWESSLREQVPETLRGDDFLARYAGTTDHATRVEAGRTYAVRQSTAHPIYEHNRVRLYRALLDAPYMAGEVCRLLGELMYQSHASYTACGLGARGTDHLVQLVRAAGPARGLYGAKVTGGGSGGVVAVLAARGQRAVVEEIARTYERESGRPALVLGGSSAGAMAFRPLTLRWGIRAGRAAQ